MHVTKEVTVSGTVGKQVFSSTQPQQLNSVIVNASISAATVVIRDGYASGETVLTLNVPVGETSQFSLGDGMKFGKGMHVKVTGVSAKCYLVIN